MLFVDARDTGFSDGVGEGPPACSFSVDADALDFTRLLLWFLGARPNARLDPGRKLRRGARDADAIAAHA
jgi:hypothetical protein